LIAQELAQQLQGRSLVSPALHHENEDNAFVIDCAAEKPSFAFDRADHFIKAPAGGGVLPGPLQMGGNLRPERAGPAADRLAGDVDTLLGEHLLDITKAQGESEVHPSSVSDHRGGLFPFDRD